MLLAAQPGAAVGQAPQAPSFLVRHERGEFRGVPGLAHGGRVAGHPAGVRVAQLAALIGAVPSHGHIGEGADVCRLEKNRERENKASSESWILIGTACQKNKKKEEEGKSHLGSGMVSSETPHEPAPLPAPPPHRSPTSLQLLLSSRQQLLCSCCYAACNEHCCACVCARTHVHACPQAGDAYLCHLACPKKRLWSGFHVLYQALFFY